ncbi:MAG: ABC transporter permease [Gemmataceae bacterium]
MGLEEYATGSSLHPEVGAFSMIVKALNFIGRIIWSMMGLIGTLIVLGLSLLPLTALIVALPAVSPNEAVLSDTVAMTSSFWRRMFRRIFALVSSVAVVLALLAISMQVVTILPFPKDGRLGAVAKKALGFTRFEIVDPSKVLDDPRPNERIAPVFIAFAGELTKEKKQQMKMSDAAARFWSTPLYSRLPDVLVQHWPFVILGVYGFDLLLLLAVGKVPIAYNIRSIIVRWRISLLTSLAFTVVVGLVVVLLAFVNGMYELNESSGIPGNVIVLSEGSTDEVFSNLGYGEVDNIPTVKVQSDSEGNPFENPVTVKKTTGTDDKPAFLMSKEIFYTINQKIPTKEGATPRRRFVQIRSLEDTKIASEVHKVPLYPGGKWFDRTGVQKGPDGRQYIQCCLGEGVAAILGEDKSKPQLEPGDTFSIGDTDWIVTGIMKSAGRTFGSEIWTQNTTLITKPFGKDKYTTLVLRVDPETTEAAKEFASFLMYRYDQQKLKAFAEQDYYAELTKTNETFLTWIIALAVIMAIGGVFGVMNTMFASITARIKEVGVLRILGFKRWQILISFMLESLAIATIGGIIGCMLGLLANGFEATSTLSSGQGGGGKRVLIQLTVDYQTLAAGMLFTLMMGRIGGLVPALSAMRMKILDTLK